MRLLNPLDVIVGKPAKFGEPIVLDLDGLGIRSMEFDKSRNKYLIVAGPYFSNDALPGTAKALETRLYTWSGAAADKPELKSVKLSGLSIESAFFYPRSKSVTAHLLSDDGENGCTNSFQSVLFDF